MNEQNATRLTNAALALSVAINEIELTELPDDYQSRYYHALAEGGLELATSNLAKLFERVQELSQN